MTLRPSVLPVDIFAELIKSASNDEYGDIRSILDEHLPKPSWPEQLLMNKHLAMYVEGAIFTFDGIVGWSYVEEGDLLETST